MIFRAMHRPGEGFKLFKVLRREGGVSASGRPYTGSLKEKGEFYGMITKTDPTETDQNKQKGSPKKYTIVQRGTANAAKATDILEHEDGRRFEVKGDPKDPGGLGHFMVYKVEERDDLYEQRNR